MNKYIVTTTAVCLAFVSLFSLSSCSGKDEKAESEIKAAQSLNENSMLLEGVKFVDSSGTEYFETNGLNLNTSFQIEFAGNTCYSFDNGQPNGETYSVEYTDNGMILTNDTDTMLFTKQGEYYVWDAGNGLNFYCQKVDKFTVDAAYIQDTTIFSLTSYGGKWQAVNLANDATEYEGVPASTFEQWQFMDDGTCTFYRNGIACEYNMYEFEEDDFTSFRVYCDNEKSEVLNFMFIDGSLYWLGENDSFVITFEKVDEFTVVDDEIFNPAFEAIYGG